MKNPTEVTLKKEFTLLNRLKKYTTLKSVVEHRLIENLTLANDIASQPIIFGIAAIIKDCKSTEQYIVKK